MKWFARAPSNIALIKYMGKIDKEKNIPLNPSLSYTLDHFETMVELESFRGDKDKWESLDMPGGKPFCLSKAGQTRFIEHLNFIKKHFNYDGHFIIRSTNNFPSCSGFASSASSFAALTLCAVRALTELTQHTPLSIRAIANLSREGSGSSCRSFFKPWTLWEDETVSAIDLPYPELIHHGIIVSHDEKPVPSSDAHLLIESSPHFQGRKDRAKTNLKDLMNSLVAKDWRLAYEIAKREFEDMHQLFETAKAPFSYRTEASQAIIIFLDKYWEKYGDGPIVTMDAGPNIHLLFHPEQATLAHKIKRKFLIDHDVI